ncbi:MAG: biotin/lipoyl-containing protein [Bacteroidota bacterium]
MLKVTSSRGTTYDFTTEGDQLTLNGESFDWDIVQENTARFHVLRNNRSYQLEIVEADKDTKTFTVKVNGELFSFTAKDRFDLLLKELGMDDALSSKVDDLKAPMPGLVLEVLVKAGDIVAEGDQLLILEAMKMENVLKATAEGVIKSINIQKGDNVQKNDVMIEFET